MIHERSSRCAVGLVMIVDALKVSETLALRKEPFLVQECTKIKRHYGLNQTQCVIRGRQRRCFRIWPILCLTNNNIIASSLIVAYLHVSPPFGGFFCLMQTVKYQRFAKSSLTQVRPILPQSQPLAPANHSVCGKTCLVEFFAMSIDILALTVSRPETYDEISVRSIESVLFRLSSGD